MTGQKHVPLLRLLKVYVISTAMVARIKKIIPLMSAPTMCTCVTGFRMGVASVGLFGSSTVARALSLACGIVLSFGA